MEENGAKVAARRKPRKKAAKAAVFTVNEDAISDVPMDAAMKELYREYGCYVNTLRSFPDVRDGLKPVNRATLFAGWQMGNRPGTTVKSARFVANAMGDFHPHGDASIYDSLVRSAQPFSLRVPLFHPQGNFGSPGDPRSYAAMRYTECSIARTGAAMLGVHYGGDSRRAEVDEGFVPTIENYDGRSRWPEALPTLFPNFVINGSSGVGVAMKGESPPHNPLEALELARHMVDSPNPRLSTVLRIMPGPDLPSGCDVHDCDGGIGDYMMDGAGAFVQRAVWRISDDPSGGGKIIEYTAVPDNNLDGLVQKINELSHPVDESKEATLPPGVVAVQESDVDGSEKVVVSCGDVDPGHLAKVLLRSGVGLQKRVTVSSRAVVDGQARKVGTVEAIRLWLDHRREYILLRSEARRDKAAARLNIVEALIAAAPVAEEIIGIVRSSAGHDEARAALCSRLGFNEEQAEAVLAMNVSKLTHASIDALTGEAAELRETIAVNERILSSDQEVNAVVKAEIAEAKELLSGFTRLSRVVDAPATLPNVDVDLMAAQAEPGFIAITADHWIRWVKRTRIKRDLDGDYVTSIVATDTNQSVVVVTDRGRVVRIPVADVARKQDFVNVKMHLVSTLRRDKLTGGERIVALSVEGDDAHDLVMFTRDGKIKRLSGAGYFAKPTDRMHTAANLGDGDAVIAAATVRNDAGVLAVAATADGFMLSVGLDKVSVKKGAAARPNGFMRLASGDRVVGACLLAPGGSVVYVTGQGALGRCEPRGTGNVGTKGGRIVGKKIGLSGLCCVPGDGHVTVVGDGEHRDIALDGIPRGTGLSAAALSRGPHVEQGRRVVSSCK